MVLANLFLKLSTIFSEKEKRNKKLRNTVSEKEIITIVANGPSLKNFKLSSIKSNVFCFVNRGYLHPEYSNIYSKIHVIIDEKLNEGIWPISMIDEVFNRSKDVTLFLNLKWKKEEKFKKYIQKFGDRIYWIDTRLFFTRFGFKKMDISKLTYGNAVVGAASCISVFLGYKNINFIGQDLNGLCYEILKEDSHFYGTNHENSKKTISHIIFDLLSMSISINNWVNFSRFCKKNRITLKNINQNNLMSLVLKT